MFGGFLPNGIERDSVRHGYLFKRPLGAGHFSVVWEAAHIRSNEIVAIKCVRLFTPQTRAKNMQEISLLRRINHPFIVRFFDFFEEDEILFIVMEFLPCGTLVDYTNRRMKLSEPLAQSMFSQLVSAVSHLHFISHVIHRDIKTENVLLDKHKNVRLVDFGLSEEIASPDQSFVERCGSPAYISPEIFRGEPYTVKSDIWSLGVILYAITHGTLPFEVAEMIPTFRPPVSPALSPPLKDLIDALLKKRDDERIDTKRLRNHPWICEAFNPTQSSREKIFNRLRQLKIECDEEFDQSSDSDEELDVIYRILERRFLLEQMSGLHPAEERKSASPRPPPRKVGLAASLKPSVIKPVTSGSRKPK
jgi:serine/threonine protein kinase